MFSIHVDVLLVPQVARAGRFGTKGLAVTFVSDEADAKTLNEVQDRFEVNVAELPEEIDISSYSKLPHAWSVKWVAFKSLLFCQNDNQEKLGVHCLAKGHFFICDMDLLTPRLRIVDVIGLVWVQ